MGHYRLFNVAASLTNTSVVESPSYTQHEYGKRTCDNLIIYLLLKFNIYNK